MIGEHDRKPDYLAAMKALHRKVADDLDAKRGDIKRARTIYAYYNSAKLLIVSPLRLLKRRGA